MSTIRLRRPVTDRLEFDGDSRILHRRTWPPSPEAAASLPSRSTGTPYEPHWPRSLKVKATVTLVGNGVLRLSEDSSAVTPVQFGTMKR